MNFHTLSLRTGIDIMGMEVSISISELNKLWLYALEMFKVSPDSYVFPATPTPNSWYILIRVSGLIPNNFFCEVSIINIFPLVELNRSCNFFSPIKTRSSIDKQELRLTPV